MARIKQFRCDFPGCETITESPRIAHVSYQRTDEEVKAIMKAREDQGDRFASFPMVRDASSIDRHFDLCDEHYAKLKSEWFADPALQTKTA